VKAERLFRFLEHLRDRHDLSLDRMAGTPTDRLRTELLSISGIGPETADSILLYAFDRPVFVVDAYTVRILARHGLAEPGAPYERVRLLFQAALPRRADLFNEYHALLVRVGKEHCRPRPRCEGCPLRAFLPGTGGG
jgi:endonuclease-3 related protein